MTSKLRHLSLCLFGVAGVVMGTAAVQSVHAAKKPMKPIATKGGGEQPSTPEIITTAQNKVPSCIVPAKLDAMLVERNPKLEAKFKGIAQLYKTHGEKIGVRWDYAYYQMILETNSLKFTGDVKVKQNNFAGLGATGGGVPGESFADVSSGVLAQLQHLMAYAGVKVDNPVAKRTRDNQDDIIRKSKQLGRAVRFADLTNRWAADGRYARSIDTLATLFKDASCNGRGVEAATSAAPQAVPSPTEAEPTTEARNEKGKRRSKGRDLARKAIEDGRREGQPPSSLGMPPSTAVAATPGPQCDVMAASFGGSVTLLIRVEANDAVTFTALDVEGGAEQTMADSYIAVHAKGGRVAGRFKSRDDAITHAYTLCDSGKP